MTDEQAAKIGKYEVSDKLGESSGWVTYRCRDPLLDHPVTIKVIKKELADAPGFMDQFRQDARRLASLRHPGIVTLIEVGEHEGSYYLVMDYLRGGSLRQLIPQSYPLPLARAIELLLPVAEALEYAHTHGVVHRNVKPGNVMFAEDGRMVLTDFGLVRPVFSPGVATPPGVGTPDYLAPEQILGKETTPATDVYALGVIAYQMLAGRVPFSGTPYDIYKGHLTLLPADLSMLNPSLPKEISDILLRALEKEPEKRFASCREFVESLGQVAIRLSSEQAKTLYQAARNHMQLLQFDQAVSRLEQILAIRPSAEAETMLKECRRRKKVSEEMTTLRVEINQAQTRLNQIMETEAWLKPAPPPPPPPAKDVKKRR